MKPRQFLGSMAVRAALLVMLVSAVSDGVARATPLTDAIVALDVAVDARVAAIPATGGTKAERTERAQLTRASKALGAIKGETLVDAGRAVTASSRGLRASRTADPGVIAAAVVVIDALSVEISASRASAETAALLIVDPARRSKALKSIAQSDKFVADATVAAFDDPATALKLLAAAAARVATAAKLLADKPSYDAAPMEIVIFRPGSQGDLILINQTGAPFTVERVRFEMTGHFFDNSTATVRLTQAALVQRQLSSLPAALVPADGAYDCSGVLFGPYFNEIAIDRKTSLRHFIGRAIVEITGRDPIAVTISGR
jgi:hypothetical protein